MSLQTQWLYFYFELTLAFLVVILVAPVELDYLSPSLTSGLVDVESNYELDRFRIPQR